MIQSRSDIASYLHMPRYYLENYKIGFTSGAFDILHKSHLDLLRNAKAQCNILVVGVNSDRSIREYKSLDRPIIPEDQRVELVDAIKYVDYTFIFDEPNNNKNIEILRPNIYFKGFDYKNKALSSQPILDSYGGKVALLDNGTNTTSDIINKIILTSCTKTCSANKTFKGLVLLDRDGVINNEVHYIKHVDDLTIIEGSIEAIKLLNDNGFAVAVVSNQPGIGMGLNTEADYRNITIQIIKQIHANQAHIDRFYMCPDIDSESEFKKPNGGMIAQALKEFSIASGGKIYMIGDRRSDALAAKRANDSIITIGVTTGFALQDTWVSQKPDVYAENLLDAVNKWIL